MKKIRNLNIEKIENLDIEKNKLCVIIIFMIERRGDCRMMTEANIKCILDASVRDISKRVGRLEVIDSQDGSAVSFVSPYTLTVTTSGDFQNVFSFCADSSVLETIAQNMMRGADVSQEDIRVCAIEFYNILCGQAISSINKTFHTKTKFSIPNMEAGSGLQEPGETLRNQRVYSYSCGKAKFEISSIKNTN